MRITFALPLLLLGACQANVDDGNDSVTLQYDENLAQETVDDAQRIGGQVANEVGQAAGAVQNEVERTDVDVDVTRDGGEANVNTN